MTAITDILSGIDEIEILDTCVRSHTGGRYWDELSISVRPVLQTDGDGPYRLLEDLEHALPDRIRAFEEEDDRIASPEFNALVRRWAEARLSNVKSDLLALCRDRSSIPVSRAMVVPEEWIVAAEDVIGQQAEASRFGFYWSAEDGSPDPFFSDKSEGTEVMIEGEVALEAIDWRNTLLARMDYMQGDDEGEIRLRPDADVRVIAVRPVRCGYRSGAAFQP